MCQFYPIIYLYHFIYDVIPSIVALQVNNAILYYRLWRAHNFLAIDVKRNGVFPIKERISTSLLAQESWTFSVNLKFCSATIYPQFSISFECDFNFIQFVDFWMWFLYDSWLPSQTSKWYQWYDFENCKSRRMSKTKFAVEKRFQEIHTS